MQISLCTTEVLKVKVTIGSINILLLIIPLATKIYDTSIQNPPWVRGDTEKISFFYFSTRQISDIQTNHIFILIVIKNSHGENW